MILICKGHTYRYESEKICRIFFPEEKIIFSDEKPDGGDFVYTEIRQSGKSAPFFFCRAEIADKSAEYGFSAEPEAVNDEERLLAKAAIRVLGEITGYRPPWGILTGVRPSKLMRSYIEQYGEEKAAERFSVFSEVAPEKTRLAQSVVSAQKNAIALSRPDSYSLYVSIPFCPSRCSYCSFVSHSIAQAGRLVPEYLHLLCLEIEDTARRAKAEGLRLETVYIGGGTPTSLSAGQLKQLSDTLCRCFDISAAREFTVEAGRPDTIDKEKLLVLKNAGVTRISINPQSFSDSVLNAVGRRHSAQDAAEKYLLARELGFDNINMDFIAGLPTDTPQSFDESIEKAVKLSPENITVHTLALKRAADMVTANNSGTVSRSTQKMLALAELELYPAGYHPYYMYRQSKSVGNLENVGWCKSGKECLYNIYMMEELHSVLSVGAGAVTKLKAPHGAEIERIYNFKYPYEYISRFDELLQRKNALHGFLAAHS